MPISGIQLSDCFIVKTHGKAPSCSATPHQKVYEFTLSHSMKTRTRDGSRLWGLRTEVGLVQADNRKTALRDVA